MAYGTINRDASVTSWGDTSAGLYGFKNRIINGAMMIDQRNAGASVTPTITSYPWPYSLDRWSSVQTQASKFSIQQNAGSVGAPAGFGSYLGVTSLSAYSVGSTDIFQLLQRVEGYNIVDLNWGTVNAKPVTLSFWVRSSLTGTFGGAIDSANDDLQYIFSYTISAANTWQYVTVSVSGPTTGTWGAGNGIGLNVTFCYGAGSSQQGTVNTWSNAGKFAPTGQTSVVGTNGATFYITGVQLEKGTTATSFDYRPYGTELQLCQRYFVNTTEISAISNINTRYVSATGRINPVPMRATPTLSTSGTYTFNPFFGSGTYTSSNTPTLQRNFSDNFIVNFDMGSSTGTMGFGEIYNATISLSAEL